MFEQLATGTLKAQKNTAKRLGSLPACIAIASSDIGIATLNSGRKVFTTWGRNLDKTQQEWFLANTDFQTLWLSSDDGRAELILRDKDVEALLPVLTK